MFDPLDDTECLVNLPTTTQDQFTDVQRTRLATVKTFADLLADDDIVEQAKIDDRFFARLVFMAINSYSLQQQNLAKKLDYSGAAVSRWAKGQNLPKSGVRGLAVEEIRDQLQESYRLQSKAMLPVGNWIKH